MHSIRTIKIFMGPTIQSLFIKRILYDIIPIFPHNYYKAYLSIQTADNIIWPIMPSGATVDFVC